LKRPEIDRRLAAGEPTAQVARGYELEVARTYLERTPLHPMTSGSSGSKK
jgi:hypothetical protein